MNIKLDKRLIESTINKKIINYQVLIENRNSIIYDIETPQTFIIGKQTKTQKFIEVKREYDCLLELAKINRPDLVIPKVFGINKMAKAYFMEKAKGSPVSSLNLDKTEIYSICEKMGGIIGSIHNKWFLESSSKYTDKVSFELQRIPGKSTLQERDSLKMAFQLIKNKELPIGRVYYDLDPLNIFYDGTKITLIDPPIKKYIKILYWDLATVVIGLRKSLQKKKALLTKKDKSFITECRQIILKNYIATFKADILLDYEQLYLVVLIMELQRVGQLLSYQDKYVKSKSRPFYKRLYNYTAVTLLMKQKKDNLKQIEKQVKKIE